MSDKTPEIYSSYKEAAEAVRSGDEKKIQDLQRTFSNLTPEDQDKVQALIDEVIDSAEAPTKGALASLKKTMAIYEGIDFLGEKSLTKAGVPLEKAHDLGRATISPFTVKCIKEYQKRQNIDSDGVIGIETYSEMLAGVLVTPLEESLKSGKISTGLMKQIRFVFEHGNMEGKNVLLKIIPMLGAFQEKYKNSPSFEKTYKKFFEDINIKVKKYKDSPKGREASKEAEKSKESMMAIMNDPDRTLPEKVEAMVTDPRTLFGAAILFLFGVFGNDKPWNNSFLKRIGVVLGVAFLGKPALEWFGADEAWKGVKDYWKSPEFSNAYTSAKEKTTEVLSDIPGINIDLSGTENAFNKVWGSMKSTHEKLLKEGAGFVSQENLPKFAKLTGEKSFLQASKADVSGVQNYDDLAKIVPAEVLSKIGIAKDDSADIQSFIQKYFLPQMGEDDMFVHDIYITETMKDTFAELIADSGKSYIPTSPSLNNEVKRELINLRRSSDPATANAGEDIAHMLLTGTYDPWKVKAENYPSVTGENKKELTRVIDEINYIIHVEGEGGSIEKFALGVSNMILIPQSANDGETEKSLKEYFRIIEGNYAAYLSYKEGQNDNYTELGFKMEDFSWGKVETAYQTKRHEILTYAASLGMTELGDVKNIQEELGKVEEAKKLEEQKAEVSDLEASINEEVFPKDSDTPLTLRKWYEATEKDFKALEEIKTSTSDEDLKKKIEGILKKHDDFVEVYKKVRTSMETKIQSLKDRLGGVQTKPSGSMDDFAARKTDILNIAVEYNNFMSGVDSNNGLHIQQRWKDLFSLDYTKMAGGYESNAIVNLDTILTRSGIAGLDSMELNFAELLSSFGDTATVVERGLSVDLGVEKVDLEKSASVAVFVAKIGKMDDLLDRGTLIFGNKIVLEEKREALEKQIKKLNTKFLHVINNEDIITTSQELDTVWRIYKTHFIDGEFSSTWKSLKRLVGQNDDPVEAAYKRRKEEFNTKDIETERETKLQETTQISDWISRNGEEGPLFIVKDTEPAKSFIENNPSPTLYQLLSILKSWEVDSSFNEKQKEKIKEAIGYIEAIK